MSVSPQDIGIRAAVHLLNRLGFGPRPGDGAPMVLIELVERACQCGI